MKLKNLITGATLALGLSMGGAASAAVIDLGFVLDGSGSVNTTNYESAAAALAVALGQIPTSGDNEYRIAVTSYGSGHQTIVEPTVVTAGNIASIQNAVTNASKAGGTTDTAGAITYMTNLFLNATDGVTGLGATSLINITTDGAPNSQSAAETAATNARLAGIDGISFEAVGSGVSSTSAQNAMARIAGLGTSGDALAGVIVSDLDNIPNATETGFVIPVTGFDTYDAAIGAKIQRIVDDTGGGVGVVPLPAGMPLMLSVIGIFAFVRRKRAAA